MTLSNTFFKVKESKYQASRRAHSARALWRMWPPSSLGGRQLLWMYAGKAFHTEGLRGTKKQAEKSRGCWGRRSCLLPRGFVGDRLEAGWLRLDREWPHIAGQKVRLSCVHGIHRRVLTRDWPSQRRVNNYVAAKWEVNFTERHCRQSDENNQNIRAVSHL